MVTDKLELYSLTVNQFTPGRPDTPLRSIKPAEKGGLGEDLGGRNQVDILKETVPLRELIHLHKVAIRPCEFADYPHKLVGRILPIY